MVAREAVHSCMTFDRIMCNLCDELRVDYMDNDERAGHRYSTSMLLRHTPEPPQHLPRSTSASPAPPRRLQRSCWTPLPVASCRPYYQGGRATTQTSPWPSLVSPLPTPCRTRLCEWRYKSVLPCIDVVPRRAFVQGMLAGWPSGKT